MFGVLGLQEFRRSLELKGLLSVFLDRGWPGFCYFVPALVELTWVLL